MTDTVRILIVDDEETLREALKLNLELEGFEADTAPDAETAMAMDLSRYSLILLDIMMGAVSGTQMAKMLKADAATAAIPVIFLSARDADDDMVAGLDLGADDYITKPFSVRNVVARVRAVLRRSAPSAPDEMVCEGLRVLPSRKLCEVDGVEVAMPRKEFELLTTMMARPGHVFSRRELLDCIWPEEVVVVDRVVDVNITRLRSKLGRYGRHIFTRAGYGYGFR